jgi:hypothetical protein
MATFCCLPLGIALLWTSPAFSKSSKAGWTIIAGLLVMAGAFVALVPSAPRGTKPSASAAPTVSQQRSDAERGPVQPLCAVFQGVPGFKSGSWRQFYEEEWGCIGGPVVVSGYKPSENYIWYHVMGNRDTVGYSRLRLVVNDRATSADAHRSLASYSEKMFSAAAGQSVPLHVSAAILSGKGGEWTVNGKLVILDVDQWPTGKGYDLRLTISLSGAADPRKR